MTTNAPRSRPILTEGKFRKNCNDRVEHSDPPIHPPPPPPPPRSVGEDNMKTISVKEYNRLTNRDAVLSWLEENGIVELMKKGNGNAL